VSLRFPAVVALAGLITLALVAAACGNADVSGSGVTIEPLTATTTSAPLVGKQARPSPTSTPEPPATEAPPQPTSTPAPARPSPTPRPPSGPPSEGRWIDVDVTTFVVRLMDGTTVLREIGPVGVGVQIDTGAYLSTQTGLFHVHSKSEPLVYDAPFDTYISHWVGFDADKDNGFHSFLKDAGGNVVDASTGRVSNGCIRTPEPEAIFAFAEIGMPVYVHF